MKDRVLVAIGILWLVAVTVGVSFVALQPEYFKVFQMVGVITVWACAFYFGVKLVQMWRSPN